MENNDIKKALECCAYGLCRDCALYSDDGCGEKVTIGAIELITSQEQKIFALENRLKECENGYEGTLHLESCKLHDVEEKVKELTAEYDSMAKTVNEASDLIRKLRADKKKLTEENERLRGENTVFKVIELIKSRGYAYGKGDVSKGEEKIMGYQISVKKLDQIAKEMLEGEK